MAVLEQAAPSATQPSLQQGRLAKILTLMVGIYTIQSLIGAFMFQAMPAVMRSQGLALDLIGATSLFMVPWVVKFLWASWIETTRLAGDRKRQQSRMMLAAGQLLIAALLSVLIWLSPLRNLTGIFVILGIIAVVAATIDITADGFLIERLTPENRGWGNVAQVGGGYSGVMLGSGLFLVLFGEFGWQIALIGMIFAILLLASPVLLIRQPSSLNQPHLETAPPSLRRAFARRDVRWGLAIIILCQLGLRLSMGMTAPFLIDQGFTASEIGALTGTLGTLTCLTAIIGTGWLVRHFGPSGTLRGLLTAQALSLAAFTFADQSNLSPEVIAGVFIAHSAMGAASFVALYSLAMGWASQDQAGVDFTLFQCMDALVMLTCGVAGGLVAEHFGYALCFGFAGLSALIAVIFLPSLLSHLHRA